MTEIRGTQGYEGRARWHSEHRALGHLVERVEALLARLASSRGRRGEEAKARGLIEELRTRLVEHLDAEEANRILEQAATVAPRFARWVDQLLGEHEDLRSRTHALVTASGGEDWKALHAHFAEFRRVLGAHERAENDLVQRAYLEDIGGSG